MLVLLTSISEGNFHVMECYPITVLTTPATVSRGVCTVYIACLCGLRQSVNSNSRTPFLVWLSLLSTGLHPFIHGPSLWLPAQRCLFFCTSWHTLLNFLLFSHFYNHFFQKSCFLILNNTLFVKQLSFCPSYYAEDSMNLEQTLDAVDAWQIQKICICSSQLLPGFLYKKKLCVLAYWRDKGIFHNTYCGVQE